MRVREGVLLRDEGAVAQRHKGQPRCAEHASQLVEIGDRGVGAVVAADRAEEVRAGPHRVGGRHELVGLLALQVGAVDRAGAGAAGVDGDDAVRREDIRSEPVSERRGQRRHRRTRPAVEQHEDAARRARVGLERDLQGELAGAGVRVVDGHRQAGADEAGEAAVGVGEGGGYAGDGREAGAGRRRRTARGGGSGGRVTGRTTGARGQQRAGDHEQGHGTTHPATLPAGRALHGQAAVAVRRCAALAAGLGPRIRVSNAVAARPTTRAGTSGSTGRAASSGRRSSGRLAAAAAAISR